MAKFTEGNFKTNWASIMKSAGTLQADIQRALMFALKYCATTGNTLYLTKIREGVEKKKGLSTTRLDGYIRHMLPVVWADDKSGTKKVYKKNGDLIVNTDPDCKNWFDFEKAPASDSTKKAMLKVIEGYAYPKEDASQPTPEDKAWALAIMAEFEKKAA